jgi:hypothetical protein
MCWKHALPSSPPRVGMANFPSCESRVSRLECQLAILQQQQRSATTPDVARLRLDVAHAKADRNALVPMGRLPDELLVDISSRVIEDEEASEAGCRTPTLLPLTAVFRRMRTTLQGAPELWTRVDAAWSRGLVDIWNLHAASRPLNLRISTMHTDQDIARVEALLLRTATLQAVGFHMQDFTKWLKRDSAPFLTSLSVTSYFPFMDKTVCASFLAPDISSKFAVLSLQSIPILSFPALPALKRVILHGVWINLNALCDLFGGAGQLEVIIIQSVQLGTMWAIERDLMPPDTHKFTLPHLRTLMISGCI